ncbi:hypothetical protein ACN2XU_20425 [Primorskyibacter sp. 2E107]|uniref:hypothetical protein n=1 Tax=Primorskyibacter sp. 2E107 TaxID=3403458 RepID=UPI003AF6CDC7
MRFLFNVVAAAACIFSIGGAANAGRLGYECQVKESGGIGYVPEVIFIGVEEGSKEIVVSDPVILYYNDGQPLRGRIKTDNAKRTTFAWDLKFKNRANQTGTIQYRATYIKASGDLNVSALPLGYADTFRGKGKCEIKPIK